MNLSDRILDCFPSGSYAMSGLLRLLDIEETISISTAAVECKLQPRLLMNPEFVAKHAQTPEKLLMLVMHELHHVLLGHTTLFPRLTPEQNFVFDAVINGIVCRMFPSPEHTAFFTDYYKADVFPECLLRPAEGWPNSQAGFKADYPGLEKHSMHFKSMLKDVHVALYSDAGASYKEVFDILPKALDGKGIGDIPLIGGHSVEDESGSDLQQQSPLLFEIVRELVESWPQPPDPIKGRSLADVLSTSNVKPIKLQSKRRKLETLIKRVAGFSAHGNLYRQQSSNLTFTSPIPSMNRKSMVMQIMGVQPMLHSAQMPWKQRSPSGEKVHVYVDVSGSMNSVLNALYGAVLDCKDMVFGEVHLFSNRIADVTLDELRKGKCITTGGTDIACVAKHIEKNQVRRALLITDGWVGQAKGRHHDILRSTKLAVAYMGESTNMLDLALVSDFTAVLH